MPAGQVHTVCPSALVCSVAGLKQVTQFVSSPPEQVTQAGLQMRQVEVTGSRYWPGGHLQVLSGYNTRNDVAHDTHPSAWIVVQILHVGSHGLHTPMESKAWPSGQVQEPVVGSGKRGEEVGHSSARCAVKARRTSACAARGITSDELAVEGGVGLVPCIAHTRSVRLQSSVWLALCANCW
jgi:hypothetical protein